jgi:hypothetical protein
MMARASLTVLIASFLLGCDPAFRFAGRVTGVGGQPLHGAEAWVECAGSGKSFQTVTNEAGRFTSQGIGWRPSTCVVVARASGYQERSVPLMSVCRRKPSHLPDACLEVVADPLPLTEKRLSPR